MRKETPNVGRGEGSMPDRTFSSRLVAKQHTRMPVRASLRPNGSRSSGSSWYYEENTQSLSTNTIKTFLLITIINMRTEEIGMEGRPYSTEEV